MRHFLLFGLIMMISQITLADFVNKDQASKVAQRYYSKQLSNNYQEFSESQVEIKEIFTKSFNSENPTLYIINMLPEGFILVAADDLIQPVLGYGFESHYNPNSKNDNFESWISGYSRELSFIKEQKAIASKEVKQKWKSLLNNDFEQDKGSREANVGPLLTSTWNQNYPYNMLCPEDEDGSGGHVYAGCVATAMSMIMHYHRYPDHGTGSYSYYASGYGNQSADFENTTYNWDAMMDNISGASEESKFQMAQIQRHCGIAVDMNYGPNGSGSYSYLVPDAVKDHFGYSSSCSIEDKDYDYNWEEWMTMLREQLDAAYPIYYAGYSDDGGHAFACDGYDADDNFHFNFGWSGSMNGFYPLSGDNAVGGFDSGQRAVINFIPAEDSGYPSLCSGDEELTTITGSVEDGSGQIFSYGQNADCNWIINLEKEFDSVSSIRISFRRFDLEEGSDVLSIYKGTSEAGELIGQYSGSELPDNVTIDHNKVFLKFTTDNQDNNQTGFLLEYKGLRPTYCENIVTLTDLTGVITDGSNDKYYNSNSLCRYLIQPTIAQSISIKFNKFELADDGDRVEIFKINPNEELGSFTGSTIPEEMNIEAEEVLVVFISNSENNNQGFEFEYIASYDNIAKNNFEKDLKIYPNPSDDQITISFQNISNISGSIKLTDVAGRVVYQNQYSKDASIVVEQIDVEDLKSGLYLLSLRNNKTSVTRKIIVK